MWRVKSAPKEAGGQPKSRACSGVWKELTDSVNQMAGNLTAQVRNIAGVTIAVANGDLSKKITVDVRGEILQLKEAINTMVEQLRSFASEVTRVAREVGYGRQTGRPGGRAGRGRHLEGPHRQRQLDGIQPDAQVRNIVEVTVAVARGDLSRKITVDVRGEILQLKETISRPSSRHEPRRVRASRIARSSAWAVGSRSRSRALPARARTSSPRAITAPIGTSPQASACRASSSASHMNATSRAAPAVHQ